MTEREPLAADDEIARLRSQLEDLQQTVDAIREGEVDAVVVGGASGEQLYTQISADRPYRVIVEEMGDGALTTSERGVVLYANERMAQLLGRDRSSLLGTDVTHLVPPHAVPKLTDLLTALPGATHRTELELRAAGDTVVPVLASVTGLDIDGVVVRCLIVADLTDQRRGEQILAEAYAGLTDSARELEEAQRVGRIGSWFWDAASGQLRWSPQMYAIMGIDPALTGDAFDAALAEALHVDDARAAAAAQERALNARLPFTVQQRVVLPNGEIRHVVTRGEPVLEPEDDPDGAVTGLRGTTQDVTEQRRAADAVDTARRQLLRREMELAEEHRVKETLQRAVLPASLPKGPGFRLAAHYLPAERPSLVGGDWYDAFRLPDGTLAVAVGDVVGHDLVAAATMGQMRNALRAYAFSDGPPGNVLGRLNALTSGLSEGALATAIYGRVDVDRCTFSWAGAGHPPPLLISAEGARFLEAPDGMMLGAEAGTGYGDADVAIPPDGALVLYTDGLVERRDRDLDAGGAALLEAAADLAGKPAKEICASLAARMLPGGGHEDDVCLLVVELLPPGQSEA
jgi:sigma-B regulation protein RsbU (phosphoserine phosphatase)